MAVKVRGTVRSVPRSTAPTSTPRATPSAAGITPRSTSTVHQSEASAGSAFGRTPTTFHSSRANRLPMADGSPEVGMAPASCETATASAMRRQPPIV